LAELFAEKHKLGPFVQVLPNCCRLLNQGYWIITYLTRYILYIHDCLLVASQVLFSFEWVISILTCMVSVNVPAFICACDTGTWKHHYLFFHDFKVDDCMQIFSFVTRRGLAWILDTQMGRETPQHYINDEYSHREAIA
jgi:hypothetical protein